MQKFVMSLLVYLQEQVNRTFSEVVVEAVIVTAVPLLLGYLVTWLKHRSKRAELEEITTIVQLGTVIANNVMQNAPSEERLRYVINFAEAELRKNNINIDLDILVPIVSSAVSVITRDKDADGIPDIVEKLHTLVDQSTEEE